MTYGDYLIKYDMRLKNGVWVTNKPRITIPPKMTRADAFVYYNNKFAKYWETVASEALLAEEVDQ